MVTCLGENEFQEPDILNAQLICNLTNQNKISNDASISFRLDENLSFKYHLSASKFACGWLLDGDKK